MRQTWLCAIVALGCASPAPPGSPEAVAATVDSCHYDVTATGADASVLDVRARCTGRGPVAFRASERRAVPFYSGVRSLGGIPLRRDGDRWVPPRGAEKTGIAYRIDLAELGEAVDDFDVALALRGAVVAPVSSWILRPSPTPSGRPVTIRVTVPEGARFATGLRREAGIYRLETQEIRVGTYAVFGRFRSDLVVVPGPGSLDEEGTPAASPPATLQVARLEAPLDVAQGDLLRWIEDSANAVARFWHGFPVPRALLVVIPVRGREGVVFGKVLPAGGPGVVLMVGQRSSPERLYRGWVLVHELFHLGFPSFVGEGKWLDEGLATYFEPIIRARAGWQTERDVWTEFAENMRRGLRTIEREGLENAESFRGIYWGGAILCLAADVAARRRSGGDRGLEHGLRAILQRGGSAPNVWNLEDALSVADDSMGAPILSKLAMTYGRRGHAFDLDGLFADLGVERTLDGVVLHDAAPLAGVRRRIVGAAPPP